MPINVIVFRLSGRKFFYAEWTDPVTGRKKTKSTGTAVYRDAERFAGALQKELRAGTYRDPSRTTWAEFREQFEAEVVPSKAPKTGAKFRAMFNAVERIVGPKLLASLDAAQLSKFQASLRGEKLEEPSIKGHLAYLHAALGWAKLVGMIVEVPAMAFPTRTAGMKGRAIAGEEFERMLAAAPAVFADKPEAVESWKYLLRGLWWSGLRLGEALALDWIDDCKLCVDLEGRRPMFRVRANAEKGYKDRTFPVAPEFAEMLLAVPRIDREGPVFRPTMRREHGKPHRLDTVSNVIGEIGKKAGVKVFERGSKAKYASAHDLRRAFGFRWSSRVMPPVLQQLMRHENIQTTMTFYVGRNAEATAEVVWDAFADTFADTAHPKQQTPTEASA